MSGPFALSAGAQATCSWEGRIQFFGSVTANGAGGAVICDADDRGVADRPLLERDQAVAEPRAPDRDFADRATGAAAHQPRLHGAVGEVLADADAGAPVRVAARPGRDAAAFGVDHRRGGEFGRGPSREPVKGVPSVDCVSTPSPLRSITRGSPLPS